MVLSRAPWRRLRGLIQSAKKELKASLSDGDEPEVLDEMKRAAKAYAGRRKDGA